MASTTGVPRAPVRRPDSGSADRIPHRTRRPRGRPRREAPTARAGGRTAVADLGPGAAYPPAAPPTTCPRCCSATTGASRPPRWSGTTRRSWPASRSGTCGWPRCGRPGSPPSTSSAWPTGAPSSGWSPTTCRSWSTRSPPRSCGRASPLAHIVHPVVVVRRTVTGKIKAFCDSADAAGCGADALTESWMAVVLDGPLDDEAAADLVSGLRTSSTTCAPWTRTPPGCAPACSSWPPGSTSCPPSTPRRRRAPIPPTTRPRPRRCCAGWPTGTSSSSARGTCAWAAPAASRPPARCPAPGSACCAATPT